jgi:hypothetical protein
VARVPDRLTAGLMEVCIKQTMSDRTDWRSLIKGVSVQVDLLAEKKKISGNIAEQFRQYLLEDEESNIVYELSYPIAKYPEKAVTLDPTKEPRITGTLEGIRGQYLFIAGRAINVRKYTGYEFRPFETAGSRPLLGRRLWVSIHNLYDCPGSRI